jgi:hypothetical protein
MPLVPQAATTATLPAHYVACRTVPTLLLLLLLLLLLTTQAWGCP